VDKVGEGKEKTEKEKKRIIDISHVLHPKEAVFTKPNHINCFRFSNESTLKDEATTEAVLVIAGTLLNRSLDMNHGL
jgi:hypothetical protein